MVKSFLFPLLSCTKQSVSQKYTTLPSFCNAMSQICVTMPEIHLPHIQYAQIGDTNLISFQIHKKHHTIVFIWPKLRHLSIFNLGYL